MCGLHASMEYWLGAQRARGGWIGRTHARELVLSFIDHTRTTVHARVVMDVILPQRLVLNVCEGPFVVTRAPVETAAVVSIPAVAVCVYRAPPTKGDGSVGVKRPFPHTIDWETPDGSKSNR